MKKSGNALWQSLSNKKNTTPDSVRRKYTQEGCERLAAAICESAVNDYRDAGCKIKLLKYSLKLGLIKYPKYKKELDAAESDIYTNKKFIKSQTFALLCTIDPDWALEELDEQIAAYNPEEHLHKFKKGGRTR